MQFSINAATQISFQGERFLHAYVASDFAGRSGAQLNLVARARQFSSFILLVGRIACATVFEPKVGIIVQNKDDLQHPAAARADPHAEGVPRRDRVAVARAAALRQGLPRHAAREHAVRRVRDPDQAAAGEAARLPDDA